MNNRNDGNGVRGGGCPFLGSHMMPLHGFQMRKVAMVAMKYGDGNDVGLHPPGTATATISETPRQFRGFEVAVVTDHGAVEGIT